MSRYRLRRAKSGDITEIKKIADNNRKALGFILRSILSKAVDEKNVLLVVTGKEVVGFSHYYHRKTDLQTTIYQLAIKKEHRGNGLASKLLRQIERESQENGKNTILLKTPTDLDANGFFQNAGYLLERVELGKKRKLNVWTKRQL